MDYILYYVDDAGRLIKEKPGQRRMFLVGYSDAGMRIWADAEPIQWFRYKTFGPSK